MPGRQRRRTATRGTRRPGPKGGRPALDVVPEFRMLVLQSLYGLSLAATEAMARDRPGWMRFRGLKLRDKALDANTLWDFREALITADALDRLFRELDRAINEAGCTPRSGRIVDASLVSAPRQRAGADETAAIKAGRAAGKIRPGEPAKAAQKDTNARWTVKHSKAKPRPDGEGQRAQIVDPGEGGARLRPPEGPHGAEDPDDRNGPRQGGGHAREHGCNMNRLRSRGTPA